MTDAEEQAMAEDVELELRGRIVELETQMVGIVDVVRNIAFLLAAALLLDAILLLLRRNTGD